MFHRLPSYNIRYSEKGLGMKFIFRLPGIRKAIKAEQKVISVLHSKHNFSQIISDNRYGCFSEGCKNVLITHQLNLETPNKILSRILNNIQSKHFKKFDEIWVPDFNGEESLAGKLSNDQGKYNVKYLGPLSRMINTNEEVTRDILVVLSGPEPQRSILEDTLIAQLKLMPYSALVIRGLPGEKDKGKRDGVEYTSFATTDELEQYMNTSRLIICRSGYSSLMDLHKLNKRAILIPTPGQSEQEYLAEYHVDRKDWISRSQRNLDLRSAIEQLVSKNRKAKDNPPGHRLVVIGGHRMRHSDGSEA
jgi:UDP-N-acetylglucosamine transferase subunit ALG13